MAGNIYTNNPWFIDATGDVSTSIPTYINGQNTTYGISKALVFGATVVAGDDFEIQDKDGNVKVKFFVRHQYCDWIDFDPPIQLKGFDMEAMTHGDAYIWVC